MTSSTVYVLDANVFIEAARRYYAFDIAPVFWRALIEQAQNGRLLSIDRVKSEIEQGNDHLADWITNNFHTWCESTGDVDVVDIYRDIITWVQSQTQFLDEAKATFANVADGWLVAFAKVKGYELITHERYDNLIRKRVPIPNVCREFGVPYLDTFEMLRRLGVRFD